MRGLETGVDGEATAGKTRGDAADGDNDVEAAGVSNDSRGGEAGADSTDPNEPTSEMLSVASITTNEFVYFQFY